MATNDIQSMRKDLLNRLYVNTLEIVKKSDVSCTNPLSAVKRCRTLIQTSVVFSMALGKCREKKTRKKAINEFQIMRLDLLDRLYKSTVELLENPEITAEKKQEILQEANNVFWISMEKIPCD